MTNKYPPRRNGILSTNVSYYATKTHTWSKAFIVSHIFFGYFAYKMNILTSSRLFVLISCSAVILYPFIVCFKDQYISSQLADFLCLTRDIFVSSWDCMSSTHLISDLIFALIIQS